MWYEEELLVCALAGRRLPTDVIDQILPGRARLLVGVCLAAEVDLQDGDAALFAEAVTAAERRAPHATGWWREALGLPGRAAVPASVPADGYPAAAKAGNAR